MSAIWLHASCAAFWVGAVWPPLLTLRQASGDAPNFLDAFSRCAMLVVALLLATDTLLAWLQLDGADLMIHDGWARASPGRNPNSAAYMTIETHGDAADRLVGAASPAAKAVELHTHIMENDIARMRPVDAIEVAPGEPTVPEPGGFHVMLMGLTGKLEEGGTMPITLSFENATLPSICRFTRPRAVAA